MSWLGGLSSWLGGSTFTADTLNFAGVGEVTTIALLAEGGYSFVFSARGGANGKQQFAAKKVLVQDEETKVIARIEAKLLKQFSGQTGFVTCHGTLSRPAASGNATEHWFLLEFCPNGSLIDVCYKKLPPSASDGPPEYEARPPLPQPQVLSIFEMVVAAVVHMHSHNPPVAHRDLKLENVLGRADGETYVLCDFGSATTQVLPAERTRKQMLAEQERIERYSTQMYRAPEMVDLHRGWPVDERVDVWALGCILFSLCFRAHPFPAEGTLQILNGSYTIPSASPYEEDVHDLIHAMLTPDPTLRPSAAYVLRKVRGLTRGPAEGADMPSPITRPPQRPPQRPPFETRPRPPNDGSAPGSPRINAASTKLLPPTPPDSKPPPPPPAKSPPIPPSKARPSPLSAMQRRAATEAADATTTEAPVVAAATEKTETKPEPSSSEVSVALQEQPAAFRTKSAALAATAAAAKEAAASAAAAMEELTRGAEARAEARASRRASQEEAKAAKAPAPQAAQLSILAASALQWRDNEVDVPPPTSPEAPRPRTPPPDADASKREVSTPGTPDSPTPAFSSAALYSEVPVAGPSEPVVEVSRGADATVQTPTPSGTQSLTQVDVHDDGDHARCDRAASGVGVGGLSELEKMRKEKEALEDQIQAAVDADDFDEASRLQEVIEELDEMISDGGPKHADPKTPGVSDDAADDEASPLDVEGAEERVRAAVLPAVHATFDLAGWLAKVRSLKTEHARLVERCAVLTA